MKPISILSICIFLSISLSAQKKKSHWSFASTNSLAFFSGNVNKFDALSSNALEHEDSTYEFALRYQFLYGEQSSDRYLLEHLASAYYDYHPFARISPFANTTFLNNIYKGFDMRLNAVAGAKYRFIYTPKQDWSISAGLMYDHTDYAAPTEALTVQRATENIWRLSIRPKIKIKIGDKAKFKHFTFYQPEIKDFENYIIQSQTEFSVEVIKYTSLSILYYHFYNSRPAYDNISKRDQRLLFGIKFKI